MQIRLLAVGDRQPSWVVSAFDVYARRLPRQWQFSAETIPAADRQRSQAADKAVEKEGSKLLARLKPAEQLILLDEAGKQFSSRELAGRLQNWQGTGNDLAFVIGGPDGVAHKVRDRANLVWSLSRLTLPHGFARVLFIEQIYRAWTLTTGHPYHRDRL